jgi:CBS domain-containing protein
MTVGVILEKKGTDVATVMPDQSVLEVSQKLAELKIGAIVVTSEPGVVAGIVSERDIVRVIAEKGAATLNLPVCDVMTEKVVTCEPGETINDLMEKMTAGRFRHVPVVKDGKLVGIVSIGDVVKMRIQEIETEAGALKSYIASA